MTLNFDTYSANVSQTPTIENLLITSGSGSSATYSSSASAIELAGYLTSYAFHNEKDKVVKLDSDTGATYKTQIFSLYEASEGSTWQALVGFTWRTGSQSSASEAYFGVFEFKDSKISGIKVYKLDQEQFEFKHELNVPASGPSTLKTGLVTEKGNVMFGLSASNYAQIASGSFYLPSKSFFLEGKHVDVMYPSASSLTSGQLNLRSASTVIPFKDKQQ